MGIIFHIRFDKLWESLTFEANYPKNMRIIGNITVTPIPLIF